MKGLYHYDGMKLFHLSETEQYAVYRVRIERTKEDRYQPFILYQLTHRFSPETGWTLRHKKLGRFGTLGEAVKHIKTLQGF